MKKKISRVLKDGGFGTIWFTFLLGISELYHSGTKTHSRDQTNGASAKAPVDIP